MKRQEILKLLIILIFVSRSYQWGWFKKAVATVTNVATNVANAVVNTATKVVEAVATFVNHTIPGFLFGNITWYAPEVLALIMLLLFNQQILHHYQLLMDLQLLILVLEIYLIYTLLR